MGAEASERLLEVLRTEKQTWWATKTNTSQSMVSNYWWKGKWPRGDKVEKILSLKQISANWLFFNIGPKYIKYLDEKEVERNQDINRETQIKIMELADENIQLKEELKRVRIEFEQYKLSDSLGVFDAGAEDRDIRGSIIGSMSLLKMMIDVVLKMAETHAKENVDSDKYMSILQWIGTNIESQKLSTESKLKELEKLIK